MIDKLTPGIAYEKELQSIRNINMDPSFPIAEDFGEEMAAHFVHSTTYHRIRSVDRWAWWHRCHLTSYFRLYLVPQISDRTTTRTRNFRVTFSSLLPQGVVIDSTQSINPLFASHCVTYFWSRYLYSYYHSSSLSSSFENGLTSNLLAGFPKTLCTDFFPEALVLPGGACVVVL